jgi:hypothetical protein
MTNASEAEIENILRSSAAGPPSFGDVVPWDFVMRWPEPVLESKVWPIVSRMLEDSDPTLRARSLEFVNAWTTGAERGLERLLDIVKARRSAYPEPELRAQMAWVLSNLSVTVPGMRRKIAGHIVLLLDGAPPPDGSTILVAKFHPDELVQSAGQWTESYEDQSAAEAAAGAMATYRRDQLLAFLTMLAGRSVEQREEIASRVEKRLAIPDDDLRELLSEDRIPMPTTRPTIEECRKALRLDEPVN